MTKQFTLLALAIIFGKFCTAQDNKSIQTDRPDQTESPAIVPKKYIQIEAGFNYEQLDRADDDILYPTVLWKYGISKNLEFRLITEMESIKESNGITRGIAPVTVGFKANLAEEHGVLPMVSFIGHLSIPDAATKKMQATYYAPAFRFTMQHTLSEKFTLGYNLGAEWDGETPEPDFLYTLTTGYSITQKLGSYIELYGFAPQKGKADHRCDGGLTYLLSDNFMADLSGGIGLTKNAPDYFVSAGFSFRFKAHK